jgi:Protein of unknown function (DUF3034)
MFRAILSQKCPFCAAGISQKTKFAELAYIIRVMHFAFPMNRRFLLKIRLLRAVLVLSTTALMAGGALAQEGVSGKLLATGGVSAIEGAGGGGLSTWALITGYGTDRQIGANVHATGVKLRDYDFVTSGVAVGIYDRAEFSYARQDFNTKNVLIGISPALKNYKLKQDIYSVKLRVAGDAVYDQDRWLPQIAVGAQVKRNHDEAVIPFLNGALKSNIKNNGADFYIAASKLYLAQSLLVNGTLRFSKANQYGLLGFEGPDGSSYKPGIEASVAYLLRKDFVFGAEVRSKRGNLRNAGLNLSEGAAYDVFVAYFPTKNVSFTAAYVNLGQIVGALSGDRNQTGGYLSLQVGF